MSEAPQFERVTAAEVEPGDRIAEARTHTPFTVTEIASVGEKSRWLVIWVEEYTVEFSDGGTAHTIAAHEDRIRPRHTKKFWRAV